MRVMMPVATSWGLASTRTRVSLASSIRAPHRAAIQSGTMRSRESQEASMGAAMAMKTTGPPMAVPRAATMIAWASTPSCTRFTFTPRVLAVTGPRRSTPRARER
ncbi:hypothetical protein D3C85_590540 [compost metagenome]